MGDTGFSLFNPTVLKTNKILKEIEQAYGWPKERRNMSYAAFRAVLQALRDRLLVQESAVGGVERLVHTVLHALRRYVAEGEWAIIQANMPKDIASLLQAAPEPPVQPTS